jgi:hypothetical protein
MEVSAVPYNSGKIFDEQRQHPSFGVVTEVWLKGLGGYNRPILPELLPFVLKIC